MENQIFTNLESAVLEWLLAGDDPVLQILRQQLASAKIKSREFTGVGFYLNFDVPKTDACLVESHGTKSSFSFGDVHVNIKHSNQNLGFHLWISDGLLDFLEAYSYGNDQWPSEINEFQIGYSGEKRNMNRLRRNWEQ